MLYQSTGSATCAVCAVGNLLALYGIQRERQEVMGLFPNPMRRRLPYVNHPRLLDVLNQSFPGRRLHWRRFASFSPERLAPVLAQEVTARRPIPLTFHMRHTERDWAGVHCVLVVRVDQAGIHVIDSLGRRGRNAANSTILPRQHGNGWRVSGAPLIVVPRPARILLGLPALTEGAAR
ncbi:hypothetical protein [Bradyrhizobium sp. LA7.1]|uniref:hypothetical protein n=1 Tax=Bradyrhizobium sp. LA7.1 TaxID=3156324 RepID=UPI00339188E9